MTLALALALPQAGSAGTGSPGDKLALRPAIFDRVEELRLDNGMLFLLLPRHEVPAVAGRVRVRVGNVDNPVGQTGLAHMFEHMAFKGTDRIGAGDLTAEMAVMDSIDIVGQALAREVGLRERGDPARIEALQTNLERLIEEHAHTCAPQEFLKLYEANSLDFNAWTSVDFTEYTAKLPANKIEVWMLLESERLQNPIYREFYHERDVVMEERRMRLEDNPESLAWELLYSLAFTAHPYRLPIIGYMSDIEILTRQEAERFQRIYYAPGNMTAALVGDFDPERIKDMIKDYFGDIPPGPAPPEVTTVEPPQLGERRGVVRKGTERGLMMCFPGFHPTERATLVAHFLSAALSRDNTSRLKHRLEIEAVAARDVWTSSTGGFERYPGVFEISATVLEGFSNEQVEAMIWEELAGVIDDPIDEDKVEQIRRSFRKAYYYSLETNDGLAGELLGHQLSYGDWRHSYLQYEQYETITPDEITALARELFQRDLVSVVYLEPQTEAEPAEEGGKS